MATSTKKRRLVEGDLVEVRLTYDPNAAQHSWSRNSGKWIRADRGKGLTGKIVKPTHDEVCQTNGTAFWVELDAGQSAKVGPLGAYRDYYTNSPVGTKNNRGIRLCPGGKYIELRQFKPKDLQKIYSIE